MKVIDDQFTLRYPGVPGYKARDTAEAAAEAMRPSASTLRAAAMRCLRESGPLTADEVASRLGRSVLAMRPRFSELAKLGSIEDSGERRRNTSGKRAIVWNCRVIGGGE